MVEKNQKLASIQVLRFVAAASVLVHNAILYVAPFEQIQYASAIAAWSNIGAAGVHIFFVISGLVMAYTAYDAFGVPNAARSFLWRRIIRIYPIYWIAAASYLVAKVALGQFWIGAGETLGALLLVPGMASSIIVPGWTLAYEMIFYLIFAGLLIFPRSLALTLITIAFPTMIVLGRLLGAETWGEVAKHLTSPLLIEFLIGVWFGWVLRAGKTPQWATRRWVFPAGCLTAGLMLIASPLLTAQGIPDVVSMGPGSALLVAVFAVSERPWFTNIAWLGESSYALYLIHQLPMIILTVGAPSLFVTGYLGFGGAITILCILALVLAIPLYVFVERPLLAWMKWKAGRRK
ncbi:acyltransferase [Ruegeria sp. R13_0]|uniref:acyltransferase family protein n=1 Tax=Ruegeria sp. R13_0 TaxID=2821099 RepID=UPI001ADAE3C7|nr:acyltransferase [Ruegeria sp. R13_0]MBO9436776.1 acyltransferase [Ruegeria sp. R13_0]